MNTAAPSKQTRARRQRNETQEILVSQLRVLAKMNRREAHARAWLDAVADEVDALADLVEQGELGPARAA